MFMVGREELVHDVMRRVEHDSRIAPFLDIINSYHPQLYAHSLNSGRKSVYLWLSYAAQLQARGIRTWNESILPIAEEVGGAGSVHDIGKTVLPKELVYSTGRLNPLEVTVMDMHPLHGYRILSGSVPERVAQAAFYHHEFQERAYPLKQLPSCDELTRIETMIVALADMDQGLKERRSYKTGVPNPLRHELLERQYRGDRIFVHLLPH